jgi:hypothetical protein
MSKNYEWELTRLDMYLNKFSLTFEIAYKKKNSFKNNQLKYFQSWGGYIKKDSLKRRHVSTDDIINAIVKGQEDSNQFRLLNLNLPPICVHVLKLDESTTTSERTQTLEIQNISSYYNLQNSIAEIVPSGEIFF